jgi:hypothetical protein
MAVFPARECFSLVIASCVLTACGGSKEPSAAPTDPEAPTEASAEQGSQAPARVELSAEECEAGGGLVVGDIGDGAIHRPDYRCPSGVEPSGTVRAPEGGPMAVEGSVCCPK